MTRFLAPLLLALFTVSACAAEQAPPAPEWKEGENYFLIDPPVATSSGDRIEVLEVFSYACPHCASFQPYAGQIRERLPDHAAFQGMPAIFNAQWEPFARAYYTAQSLGVLERTHQPLFDALHQEGRPLRSINDLAGFYASHGVDEDKFLDASGSFEVESKMRRSMDVVRQAGVDGTPSVIVNGKYRVTGASAGGFPQVVDLVLWLVAKEHSAKAG